MKEIIQTKYDDIVAINVDVQNDFCPGGALGVDQGDDVVSPLNTLNRSIRDQGGTVVFTRDWHPEDTAHFVTHGGPWPPHCVQRTAGASLHRGLEIHLDDVTASKGMSHIDDGYSGWEAEVEPRQQGITVGDIIEKKQRQHDRIAIFIGGLATDYCVKATLNDALVATDRDKSDVYLVTDAIRAVNIAPTDGDESISEMLQNGALPITSAEAVAMLNREVVR